MPDGPAPLAATYRLLTRLCPPLAVSTTDERFIPQRYASRSSLDRGAAGERRVALDAPGAVNALIDGESDRVRAAHGLRPRQDVAASRFLHHYLWSVGLLFTGPWYLTGAVPSIPSEAVVCAPATGAFRLDVRRVAPVMWKSGPQACDSAPGVPRGAPATSVTASGTPGGSATALREAVAAHVGPVLEAFGPRVRRGARALWGMATDDLASGLWFLGRAGGDETRGIRAATRLLPGGTPPFRGAADFRVLHGPSGRRHSTRTRLGCCLYYAVAPDEPCLTCPRLADAERLRRLERV